MNAKWLGGLAAGLVLALTGCNGQNGERANSPSAQSRPATGMPADDAMPKSGTLAPSDEPATGPNGEPQAGAGYSGADMDGGVGAMDAGSAMMEMDGGSMMSPDAGAKHHGKKGGKKK